MIIDKIMEAKQEQAYRQFIEGTLKVKKAYSDALCWQRQYGWCCKIHKDGLVWLNENGQGTVEIGYNNGYYIQARYPFASKLVSEMQNAYGRRHRHYDSWWQYLNKIPLANFHLSETEVENISRIRQGEFRNVFGDNDDLQKLVTVVCCELISRLDAYDKAEKQASVFVVGKNCVEGSM